MKRTHALSIALAIFFMSGPSFAQPTQVHEIQIAPGAALARLNFAGWLVAADTNYQVFVLAPPALGTFENETYIPSDDFWTAEADQLSVEIVATNSIPSTRHTLLLTPTRPQVHTVAQQDFEGAGWPMDWSITGAEGVLMLTSDAISGTQSLEAINTGESSQAGPGGLTHTEGTNAHVTEVDTLSDPGLTSLEGNTTVISLGTAQDPHIVQAQTELSPAGDLAMRLLVDETIAPCTGCPSPWQPIPDNAPLKLHFWSGAVTHGPHGFISSYGMTFRIDSDSLSIHTMDWIDGEIPIEESRIGISGPVGMEDFRISFDNITAKDEVHTYEPRAFLYDDFEGIGIDPDWNLVGPVVISTGDSIMGNGSLEIDLGSIASTGGTVDAVLVDTTPNAQPTLTAHLRIDLTTTDLQGTESIKLFRASSLDTLDGGIHVTLNLSTDGTQQRLRAIARDDNDVPQKTPWTPLTASAHHLILQWSAGDGDGTLRLWVDGNLVGERTDLVNGQKTVESVAFGAHRAAIDVAGTSGRRLLIDDVVSFY